jgi:putative acetyltransferase
MKIRTERPRDIAAIHALHVAAFETEAEATLVGSLRTDGDAVLSLVMEDGGALIGHVMFSRLHAPLPALALAPVAVAMPHRAKGVAHSLIREGIDWALAQEEAAIFVLGDPDYYHRFGFTAEAASGFECAYAGPYLLALMLTETSAQNGPLTYPSAFAAL